MKTFLTHILIICGVFMAISCGEDRTYEYEEKTQHNKWMHDMMLEHYLWADFMVLPIFSGSGMKVKTCESMMYGRNILGTDETFEGYREHVSGNVRLCNTALDYIDAITYYAAHPVPRFNAQARDAFLRHYSQEVSLQMFREVFGLDNNNSVLQ
jgi:hypothetical protein